MCLLLGLLWMQQAFAEVYQEPEAFINEAFGGDPPESSTLWLTGDIKDQVRAIMDRDLGVLRMRYWGRNSRTVWILEEIGKEKPITTGFVVDGGKIERVQVLVFRESRGYEVRYPFFTDQFKDVEIDNNYELTDKIDSINGATLSVNALKKLARLALYLHSQTEFAERNSE